jgi:hypothetical protein
MFDGLDRLGDLMQMPHAATGAADRLSGQSGQPGPRPQHKEYPMSIISTMRTGHHRLADGSLLRVDIELGRWVGTLYTPDMRVRTEIVGSDVEVHAWAAQFAA